MSHNEFDFYTDLVRPAFEFFLKIGFDTAPNQRLCMLDINKIYYEDAFFKENKPLKLRVKTKIKTGVQMVRATQPKQSVMENGFLYQTVSFDHKQNVQAFTYS
jgi:hypothetical protein